MGRPPTTTNDLPDNWKELVFEYMSQGLSDVEVRARLTIKNGKFSHGVWYTLKERDEEFQETIKTGHDLCYAWWLTAGREGIHRPIFNTGCWYANMKNRFKWCDKHEVEHTGDLIVNLGNKSGLLSQAETDKVPPK